MPVCIRISFERRPHSFNTTHIRAQPSGYFIVQVITGLVNITGSNMILPKITNDVQYCTPFKHVKIHLQLKPATLSPSHVPLPLRQLPETGFPRSGTPRAERVCGTIYREVSVFCARYSLLHAKCIISVWWRNTELCPPNLIRNTKICNVQPHPKY